MSVKFKLLTAATAGLMLSGMVGTAVPASAQVNHVAKRAAVAPLVVTTKLVTGKMDGRKGWPKYESAIFHVPAGRTIELVIHSYDDGNAPIPKGFNKVQGTVGGVEKVDGRTVASVPVAAVAHTMTIMAGGRLINIPIPVRSEKEKFVTVVAKFSFPKAGKFLWQCEGACGTGSSGWLGPMSTNGWMKGFWNVE